MIDLEALEKNLDGNEGVVNVSRPWLRAIIKEIRGNRAVIARLQTEARNKARSSKVEYTEMRREGFPTKEYDEAMRFLDKAMMSVNRMFNRGKL